MSFTDKIFGLVLVLSGITIGVYWTLWQLLSLPIIDQSHMLHGFFPDSYYLFKIPALALVLGLLLIDAFISSTNKKIAAEKARKAAAEAAKKKQ